MSAPGAAVGRGTLVVLAKAPVPGRVKTRLCPPLTPEQAAELAAAALDDVLAAATGAAAGAVVLALDGELERVPAGVVVVPQVDGGLDRRIAAAVAAAAGAAGRGGPVLLVGMDTPQLGPAALEEALAAVSGDAAADAALGPALDGGWWGLALRSPADARLVEGVPTSREDTGARTLAALRSGGLSVTALPAARDVDTWPDALAVAAQAPGTRFAAAVRGVQDGTSRQAGRAARAGHPPRAGDAVPAR